MKRCPATSDSGGYRHDYVDLTPYAGTTILLRLRVATDIGLEERGWFADDFSVTAQGETVWTDDAEGGPAGWTSEATTFTDTEGEGWVLTGGTLTSSQYYLAEWRTWQTPTLSDGGPTDPPPTDPPPASGCTATASVNQWTGGFVATVTVAAGSSPVGGWTVTAALPSGASIVNSWEATRSATPVRLNFHVWDVLNKL